MLEIDQGLEGISQGVLEDHLSQETKECLEIEANIKIEENPRKK